MRLWPNNGLTAIFDSWLDMLFLLCFCCRLGCSALLWLCFAASYLPLAHIYERNNMTTAVHLGGSVGFYSGNVQELLDDVLVRGAERQQPVAGH